MDTKYLLLILSIITLSLGQLSLKKGINGYPIEPQFVSVIKAFFQPYIFLGFFFYLLSSILGFFVLKQMPVSVALPSMSITYVIIFIVSIFYFGEQFTLLKMFGIISIVGGVVLLFI